MTNKQIFEFLTKLNNHLEKGASIQGTSSCHKYETHWQKTLYNMQWSFRDKANADETRHNKRIKEFYYGIYWDRLANDIAIVLLKGYPINKFTEDSVTDVMKEIKKQIDRLEESLKKHTRPESNSMTNLKRKIEIPIKLDFLKSKYQIISDKYAEYLKIKFSLPVVVEEGDDK